MNTGLIIIGSLVGGILGTFLIELRGKSSGKQIEYKSIFPTTKDEWTNKTLDAMIMSRRPTHISSYSSYDSGYDSDRNDPYKNPGMDAFVDETHFGMDRGLGIVNDHHHDTGDQNHF
ncbi:hypothetical protein [Ornithinibacillus xuwenensis]|jgi:hypothetical protein|uniref:Uncharacterized protein n=1 Tax=Ornithinibacillus xuwenensis TaxID=3144668 RepID=A0ABU9XL77_9BACI